MTSELNDLIARSSALAFRSGLDTGRREEQKRVFRILDELAMTNKVGEYAYISDIKEYIEDEEYK